METLIEESREFRGSLSEIILSEGLKIPGYGDYTVHREGFIVSHKRKPPNHAVDTGLTFAGEACPWAKVTKEFIESVCGLLELGYENKEIRAITGIDSRRLSKIKHRKQWKQVSEKYNF